MDYIVISSVVMWLINIVTRGDDEIGLIIIIAEKPVIIRCLLLLSWVTKSPYPGGLRSGEKEKNNWIIKYMCSEIRHVQFSLSGIHCIQKPYNGFVNKLVTNLSLIKIPKRFGWGKVLSLQINFYDCNDVIVKKLLSSNGGIIDWNAK